MDDAKYVTVPCKATVGQNGNLWCVWLDRTGPWIWAYQNEADANALAKSLTGHLAYITAHTPPLMATDTKQAER